MASGYICAGFETLATIVNNFILNTKGEYRDNFTRTDVSFFLGETCNKFLHSFGQNFGGIKNPRDHKRREARLLRKCRETGFFEVSEFFVDSGGFQISIGVLDKRETNLLLNLYYEYLQEYADVYDRAFILDIPPGPGCKVFKNFEDVYNLNLDSYSRAKNLPEELRKRIVYIHHFRTPQLWEIYSKILKDEKMFEQFDYHGTGGIIANMASDVSIPCIIYVIPLIPLLKQAVEHGRKFLNFHILGGANFRDIFFYETFKKHVSKVHGVDLKITYDSSGLFKGLMIGRFMHVLEDGMFKKIDLRSSHLYKRFEGDRKVVDVYRDAIKRMSNKYGMRQISMTEIYSEASGTFWEDVKVYSMFYLLDLYMVAERLLKEKAEEIYPLYEDGNIVEYNMKVEEITRNINGGRITMKQKAKAHCVPKSLDMLTNLDEEYCKYIVSKFLSKDEFSELTDRGQVLTI